MRCGFAEPTIAEIMVFVDHYRFREACSIMKRRCWLVILCLVVRICFLVGASSICACVKDEFESLKALLLCFRVDPVQNTVLPVLNSK